jgi:TrkA domain protein
MEHAGPVFLPKVGLRHDFTTLDGYRLTVIIRRDGRRFLGVYDRDEPERPLSSIALDPYDAVRLADLLAPDDDTPP